jgi:hypothetical protein
LDSEREDSRRVRRTHGLGENQALDVSLIRPPAPFQLLLTPFRVQLAELFRCQGRAAGKNYVDASRTAAALKIVHQSHPFRGAELTQHAGIDYHDVESIEEAEELGERAVEVSDIALEQAGECLRGHP